MTFLDKKRIFELTQVNIKEGQRFKLGREYSFKTTLPLMIIAIIGMVIYYLNITNQVYSGYESGYLSGSGYDSGSMFGMLILMLIAVIIFIIAALSLKVGVAKSMARNHFSLTAQKGFGWSLIWRINAGGLLVYQSYYLGIYLISIPGMLIFGPLFALQFMMPVLILSVFFFFIADMYVNSYVLPKVFWMSAKKIPSHTLADFDPEDPLVKLFEPEASGDESQASRWDS